MTFQVTLARRVGARKPIVQVRMRQGWTSQSGSEAWRHDVVGVAILLVKKESLKYALPFGTFLAVGALISAVAGDALLMWYLGFYS